MGIGIIGLPLSGKTTIFNAVTRGRAEVASFKAAGQQPNIGVVKVPDSRLQPLSDIAKSKKIVPAEILPDTDLILSYILMLLLQNLHFRGMHL